MAVLVHYSVEVNNMAGFDDPITLGLLGASAGFLDPHGGMSAGFQGGLNAMMAGRQMQQQDVAAKMQQQKLMRDMEARQLLQDTIDQQTKLGKTDPRSIGNALITTGHPDLISQGLNFIKASPKARSAVKVMQNGQAVYQPMMDSGEFGQASDMPAAEKLMQINQGSQVGLANPYTGQIQSAVGVGMSPGESARLSQSQNQFNQSHGLAQQNAQFNQQRSLMELDPQFQAMKAEMIAGGRERGQMQVKAAADLPQAIQQGTETVKLVDDLLKHPGFKISVGGTAPVGSALAMVPGTDAASFNIALNQLKGKQFIEAFQSLKGGGAITEIEGQKATQAMSRMEKANTEAEFTKAAREFQGIVNSGINRAKMKAGVTNNDLQKMPSQSPAAASNDEWGELR